MTFIPILFLAVQIAAILAAGIRFQRLTWVTALSLSAISTVGLVFLIPFLPGQTGITIWEIPGFQRSLGLALDQARWHQIFAIFVLYFSAIVYHPAEKETARFHKYSYAWLMMAALLVYLSSSTLTVVITLTLYDVVSMWSGISTSMNKGEGQSLRRSIVMRGISIILLQAAVFNGTSAVEASGLLTSGFLPPVLGLLSILLRFAALNSSELENGVFSQFRFYLDAGVGIALLVTPGMQAAEEWWFGAAGVVLSTAAASLLLIRRNGRRLEHRIMVLLLGLTIIFLHIDPRQVAQTVASSGAVLSAGAGAVLMQPLYETRHRYFAWVYIVLLLGFPFSIAGQWARIWTQEIRAGSGWLYVVLIPVFLALLANSYLGFVRRPLKRWPGTELITKAVYPAAPVASILSGWMIGVWSAWGVFDAMGLILGVATAALLIVISKTESQIQKMGARLLDIPQGIWNRRIRLQSAEGLLKYGINAVDEFIEGDASFLWIIFTIVILAVLSGA